MNRILEGNIADGPKWIRGRRIVRNGLLAVRRSAMVGVGLLGRSEEHTSELQSRI